MHINNCNWYFRKSNNLIVRLGQKYEYKFNNISVSHKQ